MDRISTKVQLAAVASFALAADAVARAWNNGWTRELTAKYLPAAFATVLDHFDWTVPAGVNHKRGKALYFGNPTPVTLPARAPKAAKPKAEAKVQRSFADTLIGRVEAVVAQYNAASPEEQARMKLNLFVSTK
jgi:hypothetical protein